MKPWQARERFEESQEHETERWVLLYSYSKRVVGAFVCREHKLNQTALLNQSIKRLIGTGF